MCAKVAAALFLIALAPSSAMSNPRPEGVIGLYPDGDAATRCVHDDHVGELRFYVVHNQSVRDAIYLRFRATKPECLAAVYLGDELGPGAIAVSGDSQAGVEVVLNGCVQMPGAGHVLTIVYSATGQTPEDCYYYLEGPASGGWPEAVDCGMVAYWIDRSPAIVNPSRPGLCVLAAEESTWGKVKALYK
jgi:hypothetical protein